MPPKAISTAASTTRDITTRSVYHFTPTVETAKVAIFDSRVDNLTTLLAGLHSDIRAYVLDSDRDGIEQITALLEQQATESITLVAHGFPGQIQLGSTRLESANLDRYTHQLKEWFRGVESPQLTLLSCHVASGEVGAAFVSNLQQLTGAALTTAEGLVGNGQWPEAAKETFAAKALSDYTDTLAVTYARQINPPDRGTLKRIYSTIISPDGEQIFLATGSQSETADVALLGFSVNQNANNSSVIFEGRSGDGNNRLKGGDAIAFSPDGQQVFFTKGRSLEVFDVVVDPASGVKTLAAKQLLTDNDNGGNGLNGAAAVTVSPDGRQVFVASFKENSLTVFNRNTETGELAFSNFFRNGQNGIDGIKGASSVTTSIDGFQVFVAGEKDGSLAVFNRNPETGELVFSRAFKDGIDDIDGLAGANSVAVSDDNSQVFVTGGLDNSLAIFDRNTTTGELIFSGAFKDDVDDVDGLAKASAVATSGTQVFVSGAGDDAVAIFNRDVASGNLTFENAFKDGVDGVNGLKGASSVTTSPDGSQIFVSGAQDKTIAVFNTQGTGSPGGPGEESPDTPDGGQSPDEGGDTPNEESVPIAANQLLEITNLAGGQNAITLQIDRLQTSRVSEIVAFRTDAEGVNQTQLGRFSLLASNKVPAGYTPTFTLNSNAINNGAKIKFELISGNTTQIGTVTTNSNGEAFIEFGDDARFAASLDAATSASNLLRDDAAAIDLSDQTGSISMSFSVYREAEYNNTVGFYQMLDAAGSVLDPLTGETLSPGDAGYREAAIANQIGITLGGENGQITTFAGQVEGGAFLGAYLVADGTDPLSGDVYFSSAGANDSGNDHAKLLGSNIFGFEDLAGLGDRDYNDVVVKIDVV